MSTGDSLVEKRMPSSEDFTRLERKVDKLSDSIDKLVLIEERQTNQSQKLHDMQNAFEVFKVETIKDNQAHDRKLLDLEKKQDTWINRGVGIWAAVLVIFALAKFGTAFLPFITGK